VSRAGVSVMLALATVCPAADIDQVMVDVRNRTVVIDLVISGVEIPDTTFGAGLFFVRDAQTGKDLKVVEATGGAPTTIELTLANDESVDYGQTLLIGSKSLTISGGPQKLTPKLYTVPTKAKGGAAAPLQAADGKDDSRFYFDGEVSHARTEDVIGTYDLKLAFESRRRFLNTVLRQGPLFTLQGGNDPKGDPDSMQLGWNLTVPILVRQSPSIFLALAWENTPQLEATRDFTYTNFVWSSRFRLISRSWTSSSGARIYFRPYGGIEVGRNFAANVAATKDQQVVRPLAGSTLGLVIPLMGNASVSLTGEYIRRWPVENEILITTGENGNLLTPSVGTKPRDHVKVSFDIDFTKYAGVALSYERGSLPPAFEFVDNKLALGLVIKVK
jgi:hypothetical protein